jgi:hypothetical protein
MRPIQDLIKSEVMSQNSAPLVGQNQRQAMTKAQ